MLRDVVKLGVVTSVGLGVLATAGVGVAVAALVAGVLIAGVTSAESEDGTIGVGTPKVDPKKLPTQTKSQPPAPSQEKRPETARKQTSKATTDVAPKSKSDRSPERKTSSANGNHHRRASPPASATVQPKSDRAPESKNTPPNGKDERKAPTPTPNRKRSSSVVLSKPGDAAKESTPTVAPSNNGTTLPKDKPSSLSRELEAQITPEIKEWRNEKPLNQEPKKRGAASGRGSNERHTSPPVQAKTETVPEPSFSENASGPLPLLPPAPIPKPKSKLPLNEGNVESQSKLEMTPAPLVEEKKATPVQNGITQERPSLPKPGDRTSVALVSSKLEMSPPLQAVPAPDAPSAAPVSSFCLPEAPRHADISPPSFVPVITAPIEESAIFAADIVPAAGPSSHDQLTKPEPVSLNLSSTLTLPKSNGVTPDLRASASRDSLSSVQRKNSKVASTAKKVSHSVRRVFKGPNGKIIHPETHRLTSSSSDSVDSQRHIAGPDRDVSKLASSSRESLASTKSRRSLIDGTKKGLKRMFKGSSDNIAIPPVPALPRSAPDASDEIAAKVPNSVSPKNGLDSQKHQRQKGPTPGPGQTVRNAAGGGESGNNASPLLKGMFKGRVRR